MARPEAGYEAAVPPRPACTYSSCYCEENVWKLCDYIRSQDRYPLEEFYAVFISNDKRMIPLWKQKSGHGDEPVVWDYHVILLHLSSGEQNFIYDLDTVLPFPCPFDVYSVEAFRLDDSLHPEFHRLFQEDSGFIVLPLIRLKRPSSLSLSLKKCCPAPNNLIFLFWAYSRFKQVNKKRYRGQTSEGVRPGIRQITKLCYSVDMMQTEAFRDWIMPGTPGSGVPEYHLPFLAYTVIMNLHQELEYFPFRSLFLDSKMNLDDFISMNPEVGWGSVLSLSDFVHRFGSQTDYSYSLEGQ
ncbi:Protein N-terminal glutamine amidohydrolase [Lonchura striata]|uniref:Protein N-terminal glutamine amidohydrolase n=1 Tax=Lonchura striata TaxID=40157 RepID=A0A218VDS6_9PASE|nr:Protein N-terminal glutamine amidohydrolase [Lonchura striata domestica]